MDISKILGQVLDNPDDWDHASNMKNIAGDLKPYGFLPLTMAVVRKLGDDPKNTELQQKTLMWHKYTEIRKWLRSYKCHRHSRAAFFKLEPGKSISRGL